MPAESSDGLRPSQKQTGESIGRRGEEKQNENTLTTQLERAVRSRGWEEKRREKKKEGKEKTLG